MSVVTQSFVTLFICFCSTTKNQEKRIDQSLIELINLRTLTKNLETHFFQEP